VSAQPENPWLGDRGGYLVWAEANWKEGAGWCARHWSPCPVEGLNGIVASIELFKAGLELAPRQVRRAKGRHLQPSVDYWLSTLAEPLCCLIGDERVEAIWDEVRNT
jgi:hypothetical protein